MKLKNNKAARGEFLCGNCRRYKLKSEKRKTVSIHCLSCEANIAKAAAGKDREKTHKSMSDTNLLRQRAADLMLIKELKDIEQSYLLGG